MFFKGSYEFNLRKYICVKNMYITKKRLSGRSSFGVIIAGHAGGGEKKRYKLVDFFRIFRDMPSRVVRFEYDSNRSAYLALISYLNGCLSYVLASSLLKIGDYIFSGAIFSMCVSSVFSLYRVPLGSFVHSVSLRLGLGGIMARAAGSSIQVLKKVGLFVLLRLPSKEERFVNFFRFGSIGKVGYESKKFMRLVKAGSSVHSGARPIVRGVAKNPIDHPHGGGEGRTTAGKPSVSPWGIYTKGVRTTTRYKRRSVVYKWGFLKRRTGVFW
jgi:large subunit ribosomal protein L2